MRRNTIHRRRHVAKTHEGTQIHGAIPLDVVLALFDETGKGAAAGSPTGAAVFEGGMETSNGETRASTCGLVPTGTLIEAEGTWVSGVTLP